MYTETTRLRELTIRYTLKRDVDGLPIATSRIVHTPKESAAVLMALLQHEPSEVFGVLCLSTRHHVIAYHEVGRGTIDSVGVYPREVFRAALLTNAAALILAHVHPSGDPSPSPDDLALTTRLVDAGRLLGIAILDHIVIGDGRYVSFKEIGRL